MYKIDYGEYPINKPWSEKCNSTPHVPGGKDYLIENLRALLTAVNNQEDKNAVPVLEESNSKQTLEHICVHVLGPIGFVKRTVDYWELTKEARTWLDSCDNMYLAAYFCANVKFFAEILYYLDSPKKANELFDIAVNDYDLAWKVTTTINNRLIWLRQFGLIEFQTFSLLYCITDQGRAFLNHVELVMPDILHKDGDSTKEETELLISDFILSYYGENYPQPQRTSIGYFPGKPSNINETVLNCLAYIAGQKNRELLIEHFREEYALSESSVNSLFKSLLSWGMIERISDNEILLTDVGSSWIDNPSILDLIVLIHLRSLFVLDVLAELKQECLSIRDLTVRAKVSYGFERENSSEIRNRLYLLEKAKLVRKISAEKYALTHRGEILLSNFGNTFHLSVKNDANDECVVPKQSSNIITNLRLASKDSFNPDRFEKTTRDYFETMGFEAEWIGGSGNTDVLIKTGGSVLNSYVVTVDAKATNSASVTDSAVDFDTLKEHKKKHKADYIAVVGKAFENERLINRAKEHNVVLLDVDTLERLYSIQSRTPLMLLSYKKIFAQSGKPDLSVLDEDIAKIEISANLIKQVISCLIAESSDPVTKGQLTVRDLYLALRHNIESHITVEEIEQSLEFLSSPIIGCVSKEKDFYYSTGSCRDVSRILQFIADACN